MINNGQFYNMFIRYNATAGTWEAWKETEAREACEWDILDFTLEPWHICCGSCIPGPDKYVLVNFVFHIMALIP